jgi:uncharacterized NAD-dependent epimerase/dehydratase family protein
MDYYPALVADPESEIELIRIYGAPTVALTVNTARMQENEAREYARKMEEKLKIPVILPLEDGVESVVRIFEAMIRQSIAAA